MRGRFTCGRNHSASDYHTCEEVTKAIWERNARHTTTSLSKVGREFIANMFSAERSNGDGLDYVIPTK